MAAWWAWLDVKGFLQLGYVGFVVDVPIIKIFLYIFSYLAIIRINPMTLIFHLQFLFIFFHSSPIIIIRIHIFISIIVTSIFIFIISVISRSIGGLLILVLVLVIIFMSIIGRFSIIVDATVRIFVPFPKFVLFTLETIIGVLGILILICGILGLWVWVFFVIVVGV